VDLCACPTQATFSEDGLTRVATLDPVDIEFEKFTIGVQSIFRLTEGTGEIEIIRNVVSSTDPNAEVGIDEYITTCYGTTEYAEDLTGVRLTLMGRSGTESIDYAYKCREAVVEGIESAVAVVPQVDTKLSMRSDAVDAADTTNTADTADTADAADTADTTNTAGYFREGTAFSPMYTIDIKKSVRSNGELCTWLKVEKAS
jgi:hypothetical protein